MDREAVIASVVGSRRIRWWSRKRWVRQNGERIISRWKGGSYLLNIVVHAYPDDFFLAIPCIFSLCRQIRNTRLVDQPVVLSWGGCRNGFGEGYLWWQGAD